MQTNLNYQWMSFSKSLSTTTAFSGACKDCTADVVDEMISLSFSSMVFVALVVGVLRCTLVSLPVRPLSRVWKLLGHTSERGCGIWGSPVEKTGSSLRDPGKWCFAIVFRDGKQAHMIPMFISRMLFDGWAWVGRLHREGENVPPNVAFWTYPCEIWIYQRNGNLRKPDNAHNAHTVEFSQCPDCQGKEIFTTNQPSE